MRKEDVLRLPSMPLASPSYPAGPYRFINREYMIISYETDAEVIRHQLPEPLEPLAQPLVAFEWIRMPDSSGFGSYTESGLVIPCRFKGEEVNFCSQMYLDELVESVDRVRGGCFPQRLQPGHWRGGKED